MIVVTVIVGIVICVGFSYTYYSLKMLNKFYRNQEDIYYNIIKKQYCSRISNY